MASRYGRKGTSADTANIIPSNISANFGKYRSRIFESACFAIYPEASIVINIIIPATKPVKEKASPIRIGADMLNPLIPIICRPMTAIEITIGSIKSQLTAGSGIPLWIRNVVSCGMYARNRLL